MSPPSKAARLVNLDHHATTYPINTKEEDWEVIVKRDRWIGPYYKKNKKTTLLLWSVYLFLSFAGLDCRQSSLQYHK